MWWRVTPRCSDTVLCLTLLLLTSGHSADTSRVVLTRPALSKYVIRRQERRPSFRSVHHMKGFKLTVTALDGRWRGSSPICRLFDLRNGSWSVHDEDVNCTFSLYPLPNNTQYSVAIVSLPQPEVQHQPEMGYHVTVYIPPIGPGDWRSNIRTSVDENKLTVTFSLAPSHYKFIQYDVILRGISNNTSTRHTLKVGGRVKTRGRFKQRVFYHVPAGRYRVEVMPVGGACQFDCSVTVKGPIVVEQRRQQLELPVDWTPGTIVSVDANNNVTATFLAANNDDIAQYNVILSSINATNKRQHILQQDHHRLQPVGGLCEKVCNIVWSSNTFIVTPPVQAERMFSRFSGSSKSSNDVIKTVFGSVLGIFAALLLLLVFAFSVRNRGRGTGSMSVRNRGRGTGSMSVRSRGRGMGIMSVRSRGRDMGKYVSEEQRSRNWEYVSEEQRSRYGKYVSENQRSRYGKYVSEEQRSRYGEYVRKSPSVGVGVGDVCTHVDGVCAL